MGNDLFFGSDSKFRGLNVMLATAGSGTVDLQWEYWNGVAWSDLETTTGFGDTTGSFTASGSLFWTADPFSWSPYSINGGPDLYYVRAYLPYLQSYTTKPVEARIATDILLFQYGGDIDASAMTFDFPGPVPTAVRLAVRGDPRRLPRGAAVEDILGAAQRRVSPVPRIVRGRPLGAGQRTLIPALGSGPEGRSYSHLDAGLTNGTTYYYHLEDVEHSGRTTSHPVVLVVPQPQTDGGGPEPSPAPGPGGGPGPKPARPPDRPPRSGA